MLALLASLALASAPAAAPPALAPSLAVALAPAAARPGDAVLVRVAGTGAAPAGTAAGRKLQFWRAGDEWRALAALPIELSPGTIPVKIQAGGADAVADLEVVEPGFQSHALTLANKYVEPPASVRRRMAGDSAAFKKAFAQPFAPPLFADRFDWPRRARTGGRFGDQRTLNGKKPSVHYGIDVSGPRGAPIYAANDGQVVATRAAYMSGNTVVVWHGADLYTVYFHMDRMDVRPGQTVKKGELLGALGSTGRATGPHLHWGVKVGGLYVDPESILAIDFARGEAPPRTPPQPEPEPAPEEAPAPEPAAAQ